MKKLITICFIAFLAFHPSLAQDKISSLQLLNTPGKTKNHPEQGVLPYDAPCSDCVEDMTKRTATRREFYKVEGSGVKTIHLQQSVGAMNYQDANGYWRTIDPMVKKESETVYAARQQPSSVVIDFGNKFTSLDYAGREFRFNKNISLSHISHAGVETNLGTGDWSRISKTINYTQTIFTVQDFYPGIDLQLTTSRGSIESSFILKNRPQFLDGWLVMNQELELPKGLNADHSKAELTPDGMRKGMLLINDVNNENYFYFRAAHAYDAQSSIQNYVEMPFKLQSDKLAHYVPVKWMNDPSTLYPVVMDPFVTTSDSLLQGDIQGSGYTAICDTLGCSYFMNNFLMPAGCEITEVYTWFSYLANLPCIRDDGGFQIIMKTATDTCRSRHHSCLGGIQGACFFWPAFLHNSPQPYDFHPCMSTTQCSPYSVDFELKFRRCNWIPIGGCDNTCIASNSPWIMTVVGRTTELTNVSLPQAICEGSCANLAATADWGIEPNTFTWQPGGLTGELVSVCPVTTTTYYLTVTDTCGNTDTASTTVTVTNGQNPGFTIFPNDTVCGGTQLLFTANGNDPDSMFSWYIECQGADTISDTASVSYTTPSAPSVCTVTMTYGSGGACQFAETDTFYVSTPSSPSVSLMGSDTFCVGDTATIHAIASFAGTAPIYQWFLNGVVIPNEVTDSITYVFSDGDQLVVGMTSNDSCSLGVTATDTILISVINYVMPSISAHFFGMDTICSGDTGIFNSSIVNGGTNPIRFWFLNGVLADSGYDFETPVYIGDEIVVMLISNYPCTINDTAIDTASVVILPVTAPEVDILQSPDTVCAGDTITFTALVGNVVIPPSYHWTVNGNFAGLDSTYSSSSLDPGDMLLLRIITPNPCGPDTAYDTTYIDIHPVVVPEVSISVFPDSACAGDSVNLASTALNGGASPLFEWYVNGVLTDTNSVLWISNFADGDSVWVNMQTSEVCASPLSASDTTIITILPSLNPMVTVQTPDDTVCAGELVTFTAVVNDAGTNPLFQWFINGVAVTGADDSVFSTTALIPGDLVRVEVTSIDMCADPQSVSVYADIFIDNCLGVDILSSSMFSLHPNPATDLLVIDFSSTLRNAKDVSINDVPGRSIIGIRNVIDSHIELDISSLATGIYFVKIVENQREYVKRLVVQ